MLGTLLIGGIAGAIVAIVVSLIVFSIYRRNLKSTLIQQQGWEHAQEAQQQQWQLQQEKRATALEEKLTTDVQQVQQEWDVWEQKDITRVQTLEQQYEFATAQASLEHTLEYLPFVEDASLPLAQNQLRHDATAKAHPAQLAGEDLSGRNLSRRYLSEANLRGALLTNANLFMADLSHACLVGADLSGTDLSGANLVGADLSNAILTNANMLVTDVNNAKFLGADLSKVRNLTAQQIETTAKANIIQFDEDRDTTLARIPSIPNASASTPSAPHVGATSEATTTTLTTTHSYDIIQAQSLDTIPEPEEMGEMEENERGTPILSFPSILPETPFPFQEVDETDMPSWSPSLSDDTLRVLEEIHFSEGRQDSLHTDDFDTTLSKDAYDDRRRVRVS